MVGSQRLSDFSRLMKSTDPAKTIADMVSSADDLLVVAPSDKHRATIHNYFALHHSLAGDHVSALRHFTAAWHCHAKPAALTNALVTARKFKPNESIRALHHDAETLLPNLEAGDVKAALHDVLCHNYWVMGDLVKAKQHGRASLRLKDALHPKGAALKTRERPVFDFYAPRRNIIAFSLFGNADRYLKAARENAKAVNYVYPGWSCRFYADDSVPRPVLDELASLNADIRLMRPGHDAAKNTGLFWRFLVSDDPDVDFFQIRDVDSIINMREKVAVDEWIDSDKDFHLIRDIWTHSESILAGLWGGVAGRIEDMGGEISRFQADWKSNTIGVHNHDQLFLRRRIWPSIKTSVMQHDSVFRDEGTQDFPEVGIIPPNHHVGQDMSGIMGWR